MTIDETIKILKNIAKEDPELYGDDEQTALKLGIEALKVVRKWREEHRDLGFLLLPGETEE